MSDPTAPPTWLDRYASRVALLLALGVALLCAQLGLARTIESPLESDGYYVHAERLLAGAWPCDPFRPMLFVLLTAAVGALIGSCFHAAILVSALAAAGTVVVTFHLARAAYGASIGVLAAALTAGNPLLLQLGITASSDALFGFTFALGLLALLRCAAAPSLPRAAAAGLAVALAFFSRYQAVALLPAAALAVLRLGAGRWRRGAAFAAGAFVGLLPHMAISVAQFGAPFHDENWRSVAMRHFADFLDWDWLLATPFDGMVEVLLHDPATIAAHAVSELGVFLHWSVRRLVAPGIDEPAASAMLVGTATAALLAWRTGRWSHGLLLAGTTTYVALLCASFYAWDRLVAPLLPVFSAWLAWSAFHAAGLLAGAAHLALAAMRRLPSRPATPWSLRAVGAAALVAVLLGLGASATIAETRDYLAMNPQRLVEHAREIVAREGATTKLLSSFRFLTRHVPCSHRSFLISQSPAKHFANLRRLLLAEPAGWVLIDRVGSPLAYRAVTAAALPDFLECVVDEPDCQVYRVHMTRTSGAELQATWSPDGSSLQFEARNLPAQSDAAVLVSTARGHADLGGGIVAQVRLPADFVVVLVRSAADPRVAAATLTVPGLAPAQPLHAQLGMWHDGRLVATTDAITTAPGR